jgi:uncharacterized membrane protein
MNQFLGFISELQARLPDGPPYLVTAYHIILVVAGFLVVWMILRALLHFVEKRISKYEFIQINTQVFKLIRRVMFLALVFVAGTYFFQSIRVPILEKIFHALLIIFLAIPAKNFLVIAIGYLQKKLPIELKVKSMILSSSCWPDFPASLSETGYIHKRENLATLCLKPISR